jgi:hypothetical protein
MHYSGLFWSIERLHGARRNQRKNAWKLNEDSLILKSLVKIEHQLGDSLVLSLLLKILQPTTLAIYEQQLGLVDVIERIDCLSPSSITLLLYIYKSGPALETIDLDCITLSFPQTTSKESCGLASMGGRGENGRAKTATLDALDDTGQAGGEHPDSHSRESSSILIRLAEGFDCDAVRKMLSNKLRTHHALPGMRSSVTMRTKAPMVFGLKPVKMNPTRTMTIKADQTSGREQVKGWGTHTNRRGMASWQRLTGISYSKRKEVDWHLSCQRTTHRESLRRTQSSFWQGCENIDWRCVVADQHGLQTTYKELLAESGDTNNGRKSESSMVGEDVTLSDLQLKQH